MADVKICDRCGAQFKNKKCWITIKPVRYILGKTTQIRTFLNDSYERHEEHDLCIECTAELDKFLKGCRIDGIMEES